MKKINPLKALKINNYIALNFLREQLNWENTEVNYTEYLDTQVEYINNGVPTPWA